MNCPAPLLRRRHPARVAGLLFASSVVLTASLHAQTPPAAEDETIELPAFSVSGQKADRYAPGDSISAARIRAALSDTSESISVISSEFLKDIGANSILDATRYISGMSAGRAAGTGGILDRHVIRGFENDGRTIDNFQAGFQANFEPQFIDRIEVVKGPNSILSPTGTPGGSINVITKSPHFNAAQSIALQVGTFDAQKLTVDSTGPLPWGGKKFAYRIVGDAQDTRSYLPGRIKLWDLEAALQWKISSSSQLTLKYFGFDWTEKGAVGAANTWGIGVDPNLPYGASLYSTPPPALGFTYRGKNGVTDWSTRKDRVNMLNLEYTLGLGDHVNMRVAGSIYNDKFGQDQGLPSVPNIANNRYDPYTGIPTPNQTWAKDASGTYVPTFSLLWDPTKIARTATYIQSLSQRAQIQQDFAGNFKTGPVSIQPVAGWSLQHDVTFPNFTKSVALPAVNFFAPDDNPPKPEKSTYTLASYQSSGNRQVQAYAFTRVGALDDRLFATAGAARVWLNNTSTNLRTGVPGLLVDKHDTYLAGLLGKPLRNVSVYYSFSTNASGTTFNNQPLWRTGKEHEFGVKSDFFDQRLSFTAAHFQIIQTNLTTPNPAFNVDPVNNPPTLLSNQTNHGFEFELKGGLTKNLSVVASYTAMKLRDTFNRRPRNIADYTSGALLDYHFNDGELKGLSVFGGMTHQGKSAGETPASSATPLGVIEQVGFWIPSFTIYNAGAGYTWKNLSFNLTVDNLTNHKGFWQAAGRGAVPPIPGTNVRLSTTVTF
jgi:outer membrane receptor protein involved in Fe transport